MARGKPLIVSIIIACLLFGVWRWMSVDNQQDVVHYSPSADTSDSVEDVAMIFSEATPDLASITATPISRAFRPGETITVVGKLVMSPSEHPWPVTIEFVETKPNGTEVVGNSGNEIPTDPSKIAIPIAVPKNPGKYEMRISKIGGKNYIARAKVVVERARK